MVPEWVAGDFFRGVTHRHWFLSFFIIWIRYPVNSTSSFLVLTEKKDFYGRKGKKNTQKYGKNYTGGPCDDQCGLTRVPYASKKISQHFDRLKGTWYQYDLLIVMFDREKRLRWSQSEKNDQKWPPSKMTQKSNLTDFDLKPRFRTQIWHRIRILRQKLCIVILSLFFYHVNISFCYCDCKSTSLGLPMVVQCH